MEINEFAAGLGLKIDEAPEIKIRSEKRYMIIVEFIHKNRKYVNANKVPEIDANKAKEKAFGKFKNLKPHKDDLLTFRCLEITYAHVPIETTLLSQTKYEMQPIISKWLTNEQLKLLITNE
jgi:hypothetical protein